MSTDGDSVVVFETKSPNAAFQWIISDLGVTILGKALKAFPINATGLYIFREAVPDQFYRVEANPYYRQSTPVFQEVRVVASLDPVTAALAFEAGDVDMIINYPETDFERIQETGGLGSYGEALFLFHERSVWSVEKSIDPASCVIGN